LVRDDEADGRGRGKRGNAAKIGQRGFAFLQNRLQAGCHVRRRNEARHHAQPFGQNVQRKRRPAQEHHREVEDLNENLRFVHRIHDGRDDHADAAKCKTRHRQKNE
jgi:hypothetical protein